MWLGSPVWFCSSTGRQETKLRRKQGPTGGGVKFIYLGGGWRITPKPAFLHYGEWPKTTRWWFVGVFVLKSTQKLPSLVAYRTETHTKRRHPHAARERAGARRVECDRTAHRPAPLNGAACAAPPPLVRFRLTSSLGRPSIWPCRRILRRTRPPDGTCLSTTADRRSARAPPPQATTRHIAKSNLLCKKRTLSNKKNWTLVTKTR